MTKEPEAYEHYPMSTVVIFNLVTVINYLIGIYLLARVGLVWGVLFFLYVIAMEFMVYREGCVNCYYYGKRCMSGRGVIAKKLFRKGNPKVFEEKKVTWKNLLPQVMLTVFPLIGGGYLLWQGFEWLILVLMTIPILMWFVGNPLIYGKLACLHCRQGRKCCPANDFFGKKVDK